MDAHVLQPSSFETTTTTSQTTNTTTSTDRSLLTSAPLTTARISSDMPTTTRISSDMPTATTTRISSDVPKRISSDETIPTTSPQHLITLPSPPVTVTNSLSSTPNVQVDTYMAEPLVTSQAQPTATSPSPADYLKDNSLLSSPDMQAMAMQRNVIDLTAANKTLKNDIQANKRQISQLLENQTRLEIENQHLKEQVAQATGEVYRLTRSLEFKTAELQERVGENQKTHDSKSYGIVHPRMGSFSFQLERFAWRVMFTVLEYKILASAKVELTQPSSNALILSVYFLLSSLFGWILLSFNQLVLDLGLAWLGCALLVNGFVFAIAATLIHKHKNAPQISVAFVIATLFLGWIGLFSMWTALGSILFAAITNIYLHFLERSGGTAMQADISRIV